MPIPPINLDDRTFEQLAAEGRALIPRYFPDWTDYNESDPGITLLELFAFFMEAAIYQVNRVPERSLERFAALVGVARLQGEAIEQTLARALASLQQQYRAVTAADFEALGIASNPSAVARAKAVVVDQAPPAQLLKLVIVQTPASAAGLSLDALCQQVFAYLAPRRLITTRLQVVPPDETTVTIGVTVVRDAASRTVADAVASTVTAAITEFLSPLSGGVDGAGWPFGRSVYRSELDSVIEGLDGVDHIRQMLINGDENVGEVKLVSAVSLVNLGQLTVAVVDA